MIENTVLLDDLVTAEGTLKDLEPDLRLIQEIKDDAKERMEKYKDTLEKKRRLDKSINELRTILSEMEPVEKHLLPEGVSCYQRQSLVVTDKSKIPLEFLDVNMARINAHIKKKGTFGIDGIRIEHVPCYKVDKRSLS